MKRLLMLTFVAAMALGFTGCEDEELVTYMPESHWILTADTPTEGPRLSLTFSGDNLVAENGGYDTRPFGSEKWDYYITAAGVLHIERYEYYDDDYTLETYDLGIQYDDNFTQLTLRYTPTFGKTRTYRFSRR